MLAKITLDAGGYQVTFNFITLNRRKTILEGYIEISFGSTLGNYVIKSINTGTSIVDLHRLCRYFEEHLATLKKEYKDSYVFVPEYLNFNVQALSGDIDTEGKGSFTLRFMLNVGREDNFNTRVYVGVESLVEVTQVRNFISAIKELLFAIDKDPTAFQ